MIALDVLDSEEVAEGESIDHYGAVSDEEDGCGLVGEGVTEEVEDMQMALKYYYFLSYILKPLHLLAQSFEDKRKSQENLFKHVCNFWAQAE